MKIDENSINEKAVKLIDGLVSHDFIYETDDLKEFAAMALGFVRGILDMAEAWKGELKNDRREETDESL